MSSIAGFLASLAAVVLVGSFGAYFQPGEWYTALPKPPWTPPPWLFGPVWTALYLMMAIAAWLVWRERKHRRVGPALAAYGAQLLLNSLWSWLFFGLHQIGLALVDILALLIAIAATIALFWPISRRAAWLLVPYLVWVVYASTLNGGIWFLTPD